MKHGYTLGFLPQCLEEDEVDPAVERLQAGQIVEAEREIARSGVAVGVSNEELPLDFPPARFAAGELIRPLQIEFRVATPGNSSVEIARQRIRRSHVDCHPRRHSPIGVKSRAQRPVNSRRLEALRAFDIQIEIEVEGRMRSKPQDDAVDLIEQVGEDPPLLAIVLK